MDILFALKQLLARKELLLAAVWHEHSMSSVYWSGHPDSLKPGGGNHSNLGCRRGGDKIKQTETQRMESLKDSTRMI